MKKTYYNLDVFDGIIQILILMMYIYGCISLWSAINDIAPMYVIYLIFIPAISCGIFLIRYFTIYWEATEDGLI